MTILLDWNTPSPTPSTFFTNAGVLQAVGGGTIGASSPSGVGTSIMAVTDPLTGSGLVAKMYMTDADPLTAGGQRCEIADSGFDELGSECWYAFSFYLPPDFAPTTPMVVFQMHQQPDTTPADNASRPEVIIGYTDGTTLTIENGYDATATTTTGPNTWTRRTITKAPIIAGTWTDVVMHALWSGTAGTGKLDFWINRRKIFRESNQINALNDVPGRGGHGPYFKQGVYDYYHAGNFGAVTVYHKPLIKGDSAYTTFDQFMTACGTPERFELESVCIPRTALS